MGSMVGGIVLGVLEIFGNVQQNKAEHKAAIENADYYAKGAVDEAVAALDREQVRREEIRTHLGQQIAKLGKSGVSVSSGSPILAMGEILRRGEQDLAAIRRQGSQQVEDFLRAGRQEVDFARNARRSHFLKVGRSSANMYSNLRRSEQPTSRVTNRATTINTHGSGYTTSSGHNVGSDDYGPGV